MAHSSLGQPQQIPEAKEESRCPAHGVTRKMSCRRLVPSGSPFDLSCCLARERSEPSETCFPPAAGGSVEVSTFESFLRSQGGSLALLEMKARKVPICYTLYLWVRPTALPGYGSEWPALHGVGQGLFTAPFQLPVDLGMIWLLILSFHFCSPSALGSQQMTSLSFTPLCPHTLRLCVSSFQIMFNVCPSQLLRATPDASQLVQPRLLQALQGDTWTFQAIEVCELRWIT